MTYGDLDLSERQLTNVSAVESEAKDHDGSAEAEGSLGTTSNGQLQRWAEGGELLAMNIPNTNSNSAIKRAATKAKPKTTAHPHNKQNPLDRPVTRREQILQDLEAKRQAWQDAEDYFGNVFGRLHKVIPDIAYATIARVFTDLAKSFGPAALSNPQDFWIALQAVVASLSVPEIIATIGAGVNIGLWWQNWLAWKAARDAEDAFHKAEEAARRAGVL